MFKSGCSTSIWVVPQKLVYTAFVPLEGQKLFLFYKSKYIVKGVSMETITYEKAMELGKDYKIIPIAKQIYADFI